MMNTTCERFRDDLPLLISGDLEDGPATLLREHLHGCAGCREILADQQQVMALLWEERLSAAVPRRGWPLPLVAAAVLVAFGAGFLTAGSSQAPGVESGASYQERLRQVADVPSDLGRGLLLLRSR